MGTSQKPDVFAELQRYLAAPPSYPFNAILLATDEDQVLAYVEKHSADLSALTGDVCRLLYFEAPAAVSTRQVVENPVPGTQGVAYALRKRLGIPPDKLPCIVLFERLSDDLKDVAIVSMPQPRDDGGPDITESFRELEAFMEKCDARPDGQRVSCFKGQVRRQLIIAMAKGLLSDILKDVLSSAAYAVFKQIP